MKKALKITGISLVIILFLLIAIPFAFQSQIKDMVKSLINENLNAQVEFSDVSLSLLRSFPKAHVEVSDLVITNFDPFKDETFATVNSISFTMSVTELFKTASDEAIIVNAINVNEALLTLKTDSFGNNNYDISKPNSASSDTITVESKGFSFEIEDYKINNSILTYIDEGSNMHIHISELNHSGQGQFSATDSELDTKSEAQISVTIDSTNYLRNTSIKLDALIGIDLNTNTYTFKENKGYINLLPLEFNGSIQQLSEGQNVDISFENPESSFKDFLAVIPKHLSKNIDNVETSGDFKVTGIIKGLYSEKTIPQLDINIVSNNASFKYPELPKRVEHISIDTSLKNTTGNVDDTYVNINTLNFKIDEDVFKSSATLKNLSKNILVNANIDGILNLGNITKAYPIELDKTLSGILTAKVNTSFDMNALESNAFERIKNHGSIKVSDFIFSSEDIINPIHISTADMTFKPKIVSLNQFVAQTGESDFSATGTIENLLGFLLSDQTLQGDFNVNSNNFVVSDFMVEDDSTISDNKTTSDSESLKIPAFLDCTINANAKQVLYDGLHLTDVKGILVIKDQQATIKNMSSSIFEGQLAINGNVSTSKDVPEFDLNLGAKGFDISKSFKDLELLQNLAPIAKLLEGKLNTTISLTGTLDETFSPNLNSVSGHAVAELLTNKINTNQEGLLSKLEGAIPFIDFDKLNLKDLKTQLEFADGKVNIKPFNLSYEDIGIEVSGSHGFDKTLAYTAVFDVPAKYLGPEVNQLIGSINADEVTEITIPVSANITGSYTSPIVTTDLTSSVSKLTKQLIDIEKQKLLDKGKGELENILGGLLGGSSNETPKPTDSTQVDTVKKNTDPLKESVKGILGGLLKGKKKKKDTIN
ncbi:hypothetical protein A9Q87_06010 [Flavobacteriales bacterium 34_180_T64]|nr:hypothetical protein A9Q87_06010 [Flavobacteriales bacterium 34_180_T64]